MTTYYIDFNRGNDSNNGTSTATPWKNLSKLASLAAVSGDNILLADDSIWNITAHVNINSGWTGTSQDPITISKYSPSSSFGGTPTISRKRSIAANEWTYDATNKAWWVQWFPTVNVEWGCYIKLGDRWGIRQEAAFPLVEKDFTWKNAADNEPAEAGADGAGRIYVYAPASQDPTTYYGSVYFAPHSRGTFSFSATGTNVIIENILSQDGGGLVQYYSNSGTRLLTVRKCVFNRTGLAIYQTVETAGAARLEVLENTFSEGITAYVNTYSPSTAGFGGFLAKKNKFFGGNAGYPQGNIYLQARGHLSQILFNTHDGAIYGTPRHTQDGCAIYAEVGSDNVFVNGNLIKNCYMALQDNSGRTTMWEGNIIQDCKQAMKLTDASSVGSTNHSFHNNTIINAGTPIEQRGGVNSGGIGWYSFGDFAISLKNNIFTKHPNAVAQPAIEVGLSATGTIANNSHFGGFSALVQTYQGGASPITASGTVTSDPLLDEFFIPKTGSPCIDAGTQIQFRDFDGNDITNATPDIGAKQVRTPRTIVTNRVIP